MNSEMLVMFYISLGLTLIAFSGLVGLLAYLLMTNRNQLNNLIAMHELNRMQLLSQFQIERAANQRLASEREQELLNRLMTKEWNQFVGVQVGTQPSNQETTLPPEEGWDYNGEGYGEVLVEYDTASAG